MSEFDRLVDLLTRARAKSKPLRASQSLSETLPGSGYEAFSLKGTTLRGNCVTRIGIRAHQVHSLTVDTSWRCTIEY